MAGALPPEATLMVIWVEVPVVVVVVVLDVVVVVVVVVLVVGGLEVVVVVVGVCEVTGVLVNGRLVVVVLDPPPLQPVTTSVVARIADANLKYALVFTNMSPSA